MTDDQSPTGTSKIYSWHISKWLKWPSLQRGDSTWTQIITALTQFLPRAQSLENAMKCWLRDEGPLEQISCLRMLFPDTTVLHSASLQGVICVCLIISRRCTNLLKENIIDYHLCMRKFPGCWGGNRNQNRKKEKNICPHSAFILAGKKCAIVCTGTGLQTFRLKMSTLIWTRHSVYNWTYTFSPEGIKKASLKKTHTDLLHLLLT